MIKIYEQQILILTRRHTHLIIFSFQRRNKLHKYLIISPSVFSHFSVIAGDICSSPRFIPLFNVDYSESLGPSYSFIIANVRK